MIILFQLPKFRFRFSDVGILYGNIRMGSFNTRMKNILRAMCIQQCSFRFLYLNLIFTIVKHQQSISLMDILMFLKTNLLDITRSPDIQRSYILIYKSIISHFVIHITPEVISSPPKSGDSQTDTY